MTRSGQTIVDFIAVRIPFHNDRTVENAFTIVREGRIKSGSPLRGKLLLTTGVPVEQLVCRQPGAIGVLIGK